MIVPRRFVADPYDLTIRLSVNGKVYQDESTRDMMIGIERQIAYLSDRVTLMPGDVITTGTPPGVGLGMKPPRYLKAGDEMVLRIEHLGEQRQPVIAFDDWTAKVSAGESTH